VVEMKIYKNFPLEIDDKKAVCPICKTSKKKPCIHVGVITGEYSSRITDMKAVHVDCIDLVIVPTHARGYRCLEQMFVG